MSHLSTSLLSCRLKHAVWFAVLSLFFVQHTSATVLHLCHEAITVQVTIF